MQYFPGRSSVVAQIASSDFGGMFENPELLRLLFDINPTLVFVKDRQGRFVFANKALADVYSCRVEDLSGKTDAAFNPEIDEIEQFLADDLKVMDTQEDLFVPEERVTSPTGEVVWLQTIKRPLVEKDGSCNHILGVSVDITKRVLAEVRGKGLQEQLHHYERLESLGVMAGGIAHDLNNILGPLVGYPSLVRAEVTSDKVAPFLDEMERSAELAVALIGDLLTMARRGNYQASPIHIEGCVADFLRSATMDDIRSAYPGVELVLQLDTGLPAILGSEPHIYRVLLNLVKNAFEAIDGAGMVSVATRVESSSETVTEFDEVPGRRSIVIEVTDTGIGIPDADRSRIFDPFFSRKIGSSDGTGLGLAMVYGVVKDMSGSVAVSSMESGGSRFTVRLPVAERQVDTTVESGWDYRGDEHILVVDDLPSQRQLAMRLLGALGYRVQTAANGIEALAVCEASDPPFSLAIIDMILGDGPNGVEVYRSLRSRFPDLPCIIVSGFSESEQVQAGLTEGVAAFVRKPYTQAVLGAEVRKTLDHRAMLR